MKQSTKTEGGRIFTQCGVVAAILCAASVASANPVCFEGCGEPALPVVDCLSGCDWDLSGGGHITIQAGEVVCVQEGAVFDGGVNMNGGELRICGEAYPGYLNANDGEVTVLGTLETASINMSSTMSSLKNFGVLEVQHFNFQGVFENDGTALIMSGLNVNWGAIVDNVGELQVGGNVAAVGLFLNAGTLIIDGTVSLNDGEFSNSCVTEVAGDLNVSRPVFNSGLLTVGGTVNLNQYLSLAPGAQVETSNLMLNAPVYGPDSACAALRIDNTTIINSNSTVTGNIDICDANGIEVINGVLEETVTTDCSCVPCEPPVI